MCTICRTLLSGELEYQYHPHGKPLAARPAAHLCGLSAQGTGV